MLFRDLPQSLMPLTLNQSQKAERELCDDALNLFCTAFCAGTDFCVLEGALGYNVDSHALTTSLTANRKAKGKEMELKASWAEMTGAP